MKRFSADKKLMVEVMSSVKDPSIYALNENLRLTLPTNLSP